MSKLSWSQMNELMWRQRLGGVFAAPLHLRHGNNLSCQVSAEPLALPSLVIIVYLPCQSPASASHSSICMGSLHAAALLAAGSLPVLLLPPSFVLCCAATTGDCGHAAGSVRSCFFFVCLFCAIVLKVHMVISHCCALGFLLGSTEVYFGTTLLSVNLVKLAIYVVDLVVLEETGGEMRVLNVKLKTVKGRGGAWHYCSLGVLMARAQLATFLMARCGTTVTFWFGRVCAASPHAHWDVVFP